MIGTLVGRAAGAQVGHVEAGLRSHDWRNPFPEEIDRRIVGRVAQLHYAPGEREAANIAPSRRRRVVVTNGNTVQDAVRMVPADADPGVRDLSPRFGLVSLHRIELLQDERFAATLRTLQRSARTTPLVMVFDPVTDEQIVRQGLTGLFDDRHFRRIPKLTYFRFVALLRRAAFVVTRQRWPPGGVCVHRQAVSGHTAVTTERFDGIGSNARLSGLDVSELERFLSDPTALNMSGELASHSPSDVIVEDLSAHGFVGPERPR